MTRRRHRDGRWDGGTYACVYLIDSKGYAGMQ
jgi:hypothetical protein